MKLPLSWLKEYIDVPVGQEELATSLLLSGTKVEEVEKTKEETIFDLEITPNRPDCLSIIGLAREVAAIYDKKIKLPDTFSSTQITQQHEKARLEVSDKTLCYSYTVGVIDNVNVGKSPSWLSQRLESVGIRSINNIVDITNYVMIETGQPMHAFDLNKIKGKILVRRAKSGEKVTTLDGIERKLSADCIVIEDEEKLVDLAGIMGGKASEIDTGTTKILLHVPIYDPLLLRRASQYLGLRSEASNRFEKKLDPNGTRFAFERAAEILRVVAGGQIDSKIISTGEAKTREITLDTSQVRRIVGSKIDEKTIINILERLDFALAKKNGTFLVQIPSFRTDINKPIDLLEEVARIYGYNRINPSLPQGPIPFERVDNNLEVTLKILLSKLGLHETYSSSLYSGEFINSLGLRIEDCLKISNRLVIDYEYLRPTLLCGLIKAAVLNHENYSQFGLFEIGKVYKKGSNIFQMQDKKIGAALVGFDYTQARGILETLLTRLGLEDFQLVPEEDQSGVFETVSAIDSGSKIGIFAIPKGSILGGLGLSGSVFFFELDYESLSSKIKTRKFKPLPKFPTVKEQFSMFVPEEIAVGKILNQIKKAARPNLHSLELLESTFIKSSHAVLIACEYISPNHTLEEAEIKLIRQKILKELQSLGVKIRTN